MELHAIDGWRVAFGCIKPQINQRVQWGCFLQDFRTAVSMMRPTSKPLSNVGGIEKG